MKTVMSAEKVPVCTMNSTMDNRRQWRITRKDIAEFLETLIM